MSLGHSLNCLHGCFMGPHHRCHHCLTSLHLTLPLIPPSLASCLLISLVCGVVCPYACPRASVCMSRCMCWNIHTFVVARIQAVTSMDADPNMYPILIPPASNTFYFCHHPQPDHSQPYHTQSIIYHPSFVINGNS